MKVAKLENLPNDHTARADDAAVMASFVAGTRVDAAVARRVHERAQKIRDEIRRKHGIVDIAVPAIRELRGELPNA